MFVNFGNRPLENVCDCVSEVKLFRVSLFPAYLLKVLASISSLTIILNAIFDVASDSFISWNCSLFVMTTLSKFSFFALNVPNANSPLTMPTESS